MVKKSFTKKLLAAGLVLACAAQTVLPHTASVSAASEQPTEFVFRDGKITVTQGDYSGYSTDGTSLTIQDSGVYTVTGSCSDGNIIIKKGTADVTLILDGISLASSDTAPVCCNKSSEVSIIAKAGTVNYLSDTEYNHDENHPENSNAENAVIKCKDGSNVTIGGSGTIHITANGKNGIKSGASTTDEGNASLTVEDVTLQIDAAVNDAINAESLLTVKSGTLAISAADDAIHSDYTLVIGEAGSQTGPDISVSSCYEGLEGANVTINSGTVDLHSTDDGINAANSDLTGYEFSLEIAGGEIQVDTESGDGLDSNGTLTISGGKTAIFSTSNGDNAPIDSDGVFSITGGTVFAVGNAGMAQVPASAAQNYVIFGSAQTGGQPNGQTGTLPDGQTNTQPDGQAGTLPNGQTGTLPDGQTGTLPDGQTNTQPDGQAGTLPNGQTNTQPDGQTGTLPDGQTNTQPDPAQNQGTGISIAAGDTLAISDDSDNTLYSSAAVRSADYVFYSDSALSENKTYTLKINGTSAAQSAAGTNAGQQGSVPPSGTPGGGQDGSQTTPPDAAQSGAPGGTPGGSEAPSSYSAVNTYSTDTTLDGETISSTGTDENAVLVTGGNVLIKNSVLNRTSADSTGGDASSFYGTGAASLVTDGSLYMKDNTINTDANGGAGVFAYDKGEAYIADTSIATGKDTSGGIHVAGGGTLYAWDLDVDTKGNSSAAIRSDRGGGKMVVDGGRYVSNGTGSPAIYCTADIAVNGSALTASNSEAVCIEGLNSLSVYDSTLTGNMADDSQNDTTWTVIVYQSMSGDSQIGCGSFTMKDGKLISENGGLFYTTNTESEFYLENVAITQAEDSEFFLQCTGNSNARGWGTAGSNGAQCRFTAVDQVMEGDVIWDDISTLDFYITNGSSLRGAVRKSPDSVSGNGYAKLYISSDSKWIVTGNSVVTDLYCAGQIVDENGKAVSIVGSDGTVLAEGDSEYTVTVSSYSTEADLSSAGTAKSWSEYEIEKPSQLSSGVESGTDSSDSTDLSKSATVTLGKTKYVYNGSRRKPAVTVKAGSKKLTENTDYTVTYQNNKKVGTASVTITGTGSYTGKITKTFTIVPKGTSLVNKMTARKKGFTAQWKKATGSVTGYQIQYSTEKAFAKNKTFTKTVSKASATKCTVRKLKADQKYYVRVRVYKTVDGKKYYSAWSDVGSVTTK